MTNKLARTWPFGLALIGFLIAAIWVLQTPEHKTSSLANGSTAEPGAQRYEPIRSDNEESLGTPVDIAASVDDRAIVNAPKIHPAQGKIVDSAGIAISGATVSWTPRVVLSGVGHSPGLTYAELSGASAYTESDSTGTFAFGLEAPLDQGALWVTANGYGAKWKQAPPENSNPNYADITLPESGEVSGEFVIVTVTDKTGTPVADAWVEQTGGSTEPEANNPNTVPTFASRLFSRRAKTNSAGQVTLPADAIEILYRAVLGDRNSRPESLTGSGELTLSLMSGVYVAGKVTGLIPGNPLPRILANYPDPEDGILYPYAVLKVAQDGLIERTLLFDDGSGKCTFLLEGDGLTSADLEKQLPLNGTDLWLEFYVEASPVLTVRTITPDGTPISDVWVNVTWPYKGNAWLGSHISGQTDAAGLCILASLPDTDFYIGAGNEKYSTTFNGAFSSGALPEGTFDIILEEAGSLSGKVVHDGQPVTAFTIYTWQGDNFGYPNPTEFEEAEGGEFELADLPTGATHIFAIAEGLAQSKPIEVPVDPSGGEALVFELPHPLVGTGSIIDELTGLPILGASVVVYTISDTRAYSAFGKLHKTNANGAFRITGFPEGVAAIGIDAEGYAHATTYKVSDPGKGVDFGKIRMTPNAPCVITFHGAPNGSWAGYSANIRGSYVQEEEPIAADGTLTLPHCSRGELNIGLFAPNNDEHSFNFKTAGSGPWTYDAVLPSGPSFYITLTGDTALLSGGGYTWIQRTGYARATGSFSGLIAKNQTQLSLPVLGDTTHLVTVFDSNSVIIGRGIWGAEDAGAPLVLPVSIKNWFTIQVVDGAGAPMPSVGVLLRPTMGSTIVSGTGSTDSDGFFNGEAPFPGGVTIALQAPSGEGMYGLQYDCPTDGIPIVIEWDASADLSVRFLDGKHPVEGIETWLSTSDTSIDLTLLRSDTKGVVQRKALSPGAYVLELVSPGVWAEDVTIHIDEYSGTQDVQVLQTGNLRIEIKDVFGKPLAGVPVAVWSEHFQKSATDWLAADSIKSATGMVTNEAGFASLLGLPRGEYEVDALDSSVVVIVSAGQEAHAAIIE
jgi:protocatechuate 3,4-dioxygenase beta subunit